MRISSVFKVTFIIVLFTSYTATAGLFTDMAAASPRIISGNILSDWAVQFDMAEEGKPYNREFAGSFEGYVSGVVDAKNAISPELVIPSTVTIGQLCKIVSKGLKENPETLNVNAAFLVERYINNAFKHP